MAIPFDEAAGFAWAMAQLEATPAGPQHVLQGAERVTPGELARRRAATPLKPAKPQQACDAGLFSDDARQHDML